MGKSKNKKKDPPINFKKLTPLSEAEIGSYLTEIKSQLLKGEHYQAAITHMEDIAEPLDKLCGLLSVMRCLNPNQQGPESPDLANTFWVLDELGYEIQRNYKEFWKNEEIFKKALVRPSPQSLIAFARTGADSKVGA